MWNIGFEWAYKVPFEGSTKVAVRVTFRAWGSGFRVQGSGLGFEV